jgi:hypothetical protein
MLHTYRNSDIAKWAKVAEELNAMMSLTYLAAAYANASINGILAASTTFYLSIHSASPSNPGANELVAGTGYTAVSGGRPPIAFGAAALGVQTSSGTGAPQTFAMLVTEAGGIPFFGLWTANTGGTYICGGATSGLSGSIPSGASVQFATGAVVCSVQG